MFYKVIENGYILLIGESDHCKNPITKEEYEKIKKHFTNKPVAPLGFDYRLTTNYEWEMYELPPLEPTEEQATEADYQNALAEMGGKSEWINRL